MAHRRTSPEKQPETLTVPLQFRASIHPVADAVRVGDWIVGFRPSGLTDDDAGEYIPGDTPREWEFDSLPIDWFTSNAGLVTNHQEAMVSEGVVRTLLHSGTFREEDWAETEKIEKGVVPLGERIFSLPKEVRDEVRRLNVRKDERIYVLRVEDYWLEWRLLKSLAVLAGLLSEKRLILSSKPEAEKAWKLLERLKQNATGLKPREPFQAPPLTTLAQNARNLVRDVIQQSFWRVMRNPKTTFQYSCKSGASLIAEAKSVLGVAYLVLLGEFAKGWKRCKRPDCQRLFPITDDKRKIFCSQYCGHLESLRKNRMKRRVKQ